MDTIRASSFVVAWMLKSSDAGLTVQTIETFTTLCYLFGGVAVFGAAFAERWLERRCDVLAVTQMTTQLGAAFWTLGCREVTAVNTGTHSDLAVNNITAVRQDGKDGGRVQQPINHMYDSIGCHDVGAHQTDALLTQYDPAVLSCSDFDHLICHRLNPRECAQIINCQRSLGENVVSEEFLKFIFGVIQHVQDAAISGSVHSLVGGDEHSEGSWPPQRWRRPTVIDQRKEAVVLVILSQNLSNCQISKLFITRGGVSGCDGLVYDVNDPIGCRQVLLDDRVQFSGVVQ